MPVVALWGASVLACPLRHSAVDQASLTGGQSSARPSASRERPGAGRTGGTADVVRPGRRW
jgi:hypothetical protein